MKPLRTLCLLGVAAMSFALPLTAAATVKKEGAWPAVEKKVDLEFEGKPSEGLKQLAKEAGWSLVIANGASVDDQSANVRIDVDDQPADAVLEALFVGRSVVAHRNGMLITVVPAEAVADGATQVPVVPTPPIVAAPSAASPIDAVTPASSVRGEDRSVLGGSLVIAKGEVVHTVTVAGGSLKVEGTVTGDLVVAGGSAKILGGGHVMGNATVFGGSLKVERNARIDGDVGVAGGSLKREDGSFIGGRVVDGEHHGRVKIGMGDGGTKAEVTSTDGESRRSRFSQAAHDFGRSVTKMALLFVLGCVLLALLSARMEKLRVEVASRPMRSFAVGLLGTLVGAVGLAIVVTVLCITVIGIPVAIIGLLLGIIAVYGAVASVLTTFGAAVIGHRTQNPYLHLLLGCGAFLVLSAIPWIGPLVTFAVAMIAIGALVATRAGGLLARRRKMPPAGLV